MINHCDRLITHLSDTVTVQSETYHDKSGRTGNANLLIGGKISIGAQVT
jgi:hypothetical protein